MSGCDIWQATSINGALAATCPETPVGIERNIWHSPPVKCNGFPFGR